MQYTRYRTPKAHRHGCVDVELFSLEVAEGSWICSFVPSVAARDGGQSVSDVVLRIQAASAEIKKAS